MTDFTGRWLSTFGPLELTQDGDAVSGTYSNRGAHGTVAGKLENGRFVFRYREPAEEGDGWLELQRFGKFIGAWQPPGRADWFPWQGQREWDGVWDTSFGRVRLIQEQDRVVGFYEGFGPARIEGHIDGNRLTFRYEEPQTRGEGWFELDDGLQRFDGQWRSETMTNWSAWQGARVQATSGLTWLIVIEAHWQRSLADREYSFGNMLKEFFARLPHVAVRQRFFNDEISLARWCRELLYFPEPAIVMIASHGTPQGLTVHGKTINTRLVIDSLRDADNVQLLHFSACLVMQDQPDSAFVGHIERDLPFPVSGYTTSVDWGGSAIIEFNYLDMMLAKGLPAEKAARQLPALIAYAGDEGTADSPYASAGFRFFPAGGAPRINEAVALVQRDGHQT
jgi:hypothetical protein